MVCTTPHCKPLSIAQLEQQNVTDGLFHLVCWILTLVGLTMLSGAIRHIKSWSGKALAGAILVGCGAFNFVEGIIDHQMLGIHHVLPDDPNQFLYDMLFLASGVVLALIGWSMGRSSATTDTRRIDCGCRVQVRLSR